jgi:Family of unknown function (DUF6525)
MSRNLVSPRSRWRVADPMAAHDRLPPPLRRWLAQAALPWSAVSARRIWDGALAANLCPHAALSRAEVRMLAAEAPCVWGPGYPPVGDSVSVPTPFEP